ncbi:MAG: hypothetical protein Satyrvirus27_3 [Satyrvirus sp.]|uniref:Uncharacterized protein n=1 Tax=Satyrvirus sp. TaxID=2487771 RepID=A0A3G5AEH9_9VIRU|nr:MAG: hypothetical protein Satyrvirus27_3 [Satyrvirus sp.]
MDSVPAGCEKKREMLYRHQQQYLFVWDETPLGVKIQYKSTSFSDALQSVIADYQFRMVALFVNARFTQNGAIWVFYVPSVQDLHSGGIYVTNAADRSTAIETILKGLVELFYDAMLKQSVRKVRS